jgi:glucosamine--fructose-6-phosphate aminotransferase (isomerizing)
MMLAVAWLLAARQAADSAVQLVDACERLLRERSEIAVRLGRMESLSKFFFLGGGALFGLASEAMLKMMEMSLCQAGGFHFLEFRHGPMSLVSPGSLVIGLMSQAEAQERKVLAEMRALGAATLAVAPSPDRELVEVCDAVIPLGQALPDVWRAPLYLPILQLLAYERAMARGLDPDRPAHLDAVVTIDE